MSKVGVNGNDEEYFYRGWTSGSGKRLDNAAERQCADRRAGSAVIAISGESTLANEGGELDPYRAGAAGWHVVCGLDGRVLARDPNGQRAAEMEIQSRR